MRRILAAVAVLFVAAVGIAVCWPQLIGVEQLPIVAQVASFRGLVLVACGALAVVLLLSAVRSATSRRFGLALLAVVVMVAAIDGIVVASRGVATGDAALDAPDDAVVVLAWNTLGDSPGVDVVAGLIERTDADIVALPETSAAFADELVAATGMPFDVLVRADSEELKALSTVLLVRSDLAAVDDGTVRGRTNLPSVPATSSIGRLVAVHATAPLPSAMGQWSDDLDWLGGVCDDPRTIMAGDFNATVDHMSRTADRSVAGAVIGQCRDAATIAGAGASGTWPSAAPAFFGTPIDHVVIGSAWDVADYAVITHEDGTGSDHRPVVAALVPSGVDGGGAG